MMNFKTILNYKVFLIIGLAFLFGPSKLTAQPEPAKLASLDRLSYQDLFDAMLDANWGISDHEASIEALRQTFVTSFGKQKGEMARYLRRFLTHCAIYDEESAQKLKGLYSKLCKYFKKYPNKAKTHHKTQAINFALQLKRFFEEQQVFCYKGGGLTWHLLQHKTKLIIAAGITSTLAALGIGLLPLGIKHGRRVWLEYQSNSGNIDAKNQLRKEETTVLNKAKQTLESLGQPVQCANCESIVGTQKARQDTPLPKFDDAEIDIKAQGCGKPQIGITCFFHAVANAWRLAEKSSSSSDFSKAQAEVVIMITKLKKRRQDLMTENKYQQIAKLVNQRDEIDKSIQHLTTPSSEAINKMKVKLREFQPSAGEKLTLAKLLVDTNDDAAKNNILENLTPKGKLGKNTTADEKKQAQQWIKLATELVAIEEKQKERLETIKALNKILATLTPAGKLKESEDFSSPELKDAAEQSILHSQIISDNYLSTDAVFKLGEFLGDKAVPWALPKNFNDKSVIIACSATNPNGLAGLHQAFQSSVANLLSQNHWESANLPPNLFCLTPEKIRDFQNGIKPLCLVFQVTCPAQHWICAKFELKPAVTPNSKMQLSITCVDSTSTSNAFSGYFSLDVQRKLIELGYAIAKLNPDDFIIPEELLAHLPVKQTDIEGEGQAQWTGLECVALLGDTPQAPFVERFKNVKPEALAAIVTRIEVSIADATSKTKVVSTTPHIQLLDMILKNSQDLQHLQAQAQALRQKYPAT